MAEDAREGIDLPRWSARRCSLAHQARTGREVIELLDHGVTPEAIITDVRMAGITGLSLITALREAGRTTPIIVMSAYANEQLRAIATQLGADATFSKPFDIDDLRTIVMNMLRPNLVGT